MKKSIKSDNKRNSTNYWKNKIMSENMLAYLENESVFKINLPMRERNINIVRAVCCDNESYYTLATKYGISAVRVRQIIISYVTAVSRAKSRGEI